MSEWEGKSDFEISEAVANLSFDGSVVYAQNGLARVQVAGGDDFYFNPCKDPSDAWPIIVENKISINHEIARYAASALVYDKKFKEGFNIFSYRGEMGFTSSSDALRAAMIVYLEMSGVKP